MGERLSSIKPERDEARLFNARAIVAGGFILFALLGILAAVLDHPKAKSHIEVVGYFVAFLMAAITIALLTTLYTP